MNVLRQAIVIGCLFMHCVIEQILFHVFSLICYDAWKQRMPIELTNTLVVALFIVLQPLL